MSSGTYLKVEARPLTIITADPPWKWDDKLPGERGASAHLLPQTLESLCETELPPLGHDAVLFLWRPASRLGDALRVASAWGFEPKTELVWIKTTVKGNRAFGMGRIVRGEHETCVIATRGKPFVHNKSVRSTFSAPVVPYGKPEAFYAIVAELFPEGTWFDRTAQHWSAGWVHKSRASVVQSSVG
jgi:N6-adenosine-specific RNA methylase IME4